MMITLGVESSCDDTGLALYSCTDGLLEHYTYSQTDEHQPYGGVVPEIAARAHSERIVFCYNQLMSKTKKRYPIDAVAYTAGPGLIGALMVGACFGYAIATPAIGSATSKLAGAATMGGSLGVVQGFGSLGQVVGLVVAGPLYDLGGSQYPFGFGVAITLAMLLLIPYLARPGTPVEEG